MTAATLNEDEEVPQRLTKDQVLLKIDFEGGLLEAVAYGVTAEQLPEDTPNDVVLCWYELQKMAKVYSSIAEWLYGSGVSSLSS